MTGTHIYIPMTAPASLTLEEWEVILHEIGQRWSIPSNQPDEIPHWSLAPDGTAIIEALWQSEKIAVPEVLEGVIAEIISELYPKYDQRTIRDELTDKIVPLEPDAGVHESREAALRYLEDNKVRLENPRTRKEGDGAGRL